MRDLLLFQRFYRKARKQALQNVNRPRSCGVRLSGLPPLNVAPARRMPGIKCRQQKARDHIRQRQHGANRQPLPMKTAAIKLCGTGFRELPHKPSATADSAGIEKAARGHRLRNNKRQISVDKRSLPIRLRC